MATLTTNFLPFAGKKKRNCMPCMLFMAKGNFIKAELSASAPTAHIVARSCRNFEKVL
jgi:hypothetical protein